MWSIAMAGGYANWYIGTTAWDVPPPLNCPLLSTDQLCCGILLVLCVYRDSLKMNIARRR